MTKCKFPEVMFHLLTFFRTFSVMSFSITISISEASNFWIVMREINTNLYLLDYAAPRRPGPGLGGPPAGEAGGDDPQPGGLVHEDCDQDLPRHGAQGHHVPHDKRLQELHQHGAAGQPLRHWRHGKP